MNQKALMIIGMHRSGTSAITRVLNLLGVFIGDKLLSSREDNVRGYWEHADINAVHDRLLQVMHHNWSDVLPFPEKWWLDEKVQDFRREIVEILTRDFKDRELWGLKDPRLCRLLPIWHSILSELHCEEYFVIIFRNPVEVASSLAKRNGFTIYKSALLWFRHISDSEAYTRGYPRAFVEYSQLLENWGTVIENISRRLRISLQKGVPSVEREITNFLSSTLRHHNESYEEMVKRHDLPSFVVNTYRELLKASQDDGYDLTESLTSSKIEFEERLEVFSPVIAALQEVGISNDERTAWGRLVSERDAAVGQRDSQLAELQAQVSERDGVIAQRDSQLAELQAQVSERDGVIAQREGQISSLKEVVAELEGKIASLNFIARRIKAPLRLGRRFIGSILHPLSAYRLSRDMRIIKGSNVFDIDYYLSRYRDVRISTCNPIRHYCEFGWKEGRNPSLLFDTNYYLTANPDIAAVGINPFVHYIKYGKMEGRVLLSEGNTASSFTRDSHKPCLREVTKGSGLVRVNLAKTTKYYQQYGMRQTLKKITAKIREDRNQTIVPGDDYRIPFIYPLNTKVSSETGRRINLMVPSLEKQHLYGGVATAISLFEKMAKHFPKARVIVTDSPGGDYDRKSFEKYELVFINDRYTTWLDVSAGDVFVATAWWTAYILQPVLTWQQQEYGLQNPHYFYLIQDYEPGFYPWSTIFALAESTYHSSHRTIAVFNTQILKEYFDGLGYRFYKAFFFDPPMNQNLLEGVEKSRSTKRNRPYQIIVYGRPSVERNCFDLTIQALRDWCRGSLTCRQWSIISAGESHPNIQLSEGIYVKSVGKLSLSDYQDLLIRSSVGISFMISPHPSYPPLEMAAYGLEVVTNNFANKDLSFSAGNITSISILTPENVAQTVEEACTKVELRSGMPAVAANNIFETGNDYERVIKQFEPYF